MYCAKCGVENSDSAVQCVNCGAALGQTPVPIPPAGLTPPQTCGLAIAALVMGILSIFCNFIMAIPAIICGIIALIKINKSRGRLVGNGYAIAGIAVPAFVMVLVTPMVLAILMPALSKARHIAARVVCGTNLKGLSTAMIVYMNDYDDRYPTPEQWCDLLMQEADVAPQSFKCPESDAEYAYAINENLKGLNGRMVETVTANRMVVLFEADLGQNGVGGRDDVMLRHDHVEQAGCNIVFADGHVEFVTEDRLDDLVWNFTRSR